MDGRGASRTAMAVAMMRSCHTRRDPKPLIDDLWGDRLVPEAAHAEVRERVLAELRAKNPGNTPAPQDDVVDRYLRRRPSYSNVILRSRYTEDALEVAVREGTRQYVIIGAGFDSFFLRRPAFAKAIDIYEIDHPATQSVKLQRLKDYGVAIPGATHFIAADLGRESLRAALARSPFQFDAPVFFAWLGVTMYLPMDANLVTLRDIARSAAPGSGLVFTYLDERALKASVQSPELQELSRTVASLSEPFVSGFDPATLPELLRKVGMKLIEDIAGPQLVQRYDAPGTNGLRSSNDSRIALARIAEPN